MTRHTHDALSRGLSAADQTALCLSWSQHRRPNCLSCCNTRHMHYQSEKALSVPLRLQSDLAQCTRRAQIRAKQDSGESGVLRFLFPTFGGIVALLPQFILFSGTFNTWGNDPNAMQFLLWRACWLLWLHTARFERCGAQQGGCRSSASRTNAEPQQLHHNNAAMHFATLSRRSSSIVLCAGRHGPPNARTTVVIRPLPVRLCVGPLSPSATLQAHKDDHSCKCMA